jgi:TusA-related sulfurtransferase
MKRYLQLLGEMKSYQMPQAKRAVEDLESDDELVVVLPEQSAAEAIQQWATNQGYTASKPVKSGEGIGGVRWHVTVRRSRPVEGAPSSGAPAPPAAAS